MSAEAPPAGVEAASEALSDGGIGWSAARDNAGDPSLSLTGELAPAGSIFTSDGCVGFDVGLELFLPPDEESGKRRRSSGESLSTRMFLEPVRTRPLAVMSRISCFSAGNVVLGVVIDHSV